MIRASDLLPPLPRPLAGPSTRSTEAASAASWFDASAAGAETHIGIDLRGDARGLSVEQHAARVLGCLCADSNEPA